MLKNYYVHSVVFFLVFFSINSLSADLVHFKNDLNLVKNNRFDTVDKGKSNHNRLGKSEYEDNSVPVMQLGPEYYIEHLVPENNLLNSEKSEDNLLTNKRNECDFQAKLNHHGEMSLHTAAKNGDNLAVEKLLNDKKLLYCLDISGKSPAWYAANNNHWSTLALLLRSGATLTQDIQKTKAWDELFKGDTYLKKLFDQSKPMDVSKEKEKLDGILIWSCMKSNFNLTQFLIDLGADLNSPKFGNSQLWLPLTRGNFEMADFLISKGAKIDGKNRHGLTLLHIAAVVDDVPVLQFLLDRGMDVNMKANNGLTPLNMANGAAWSYIKSRGGMLA